jgi:hypothetical protein
MAKADADIGLESVICDQNNPSTWEQGMDADVHVVHSHLPDKITFKKGTKMVIIQHGSPEHVFEISVQQGAAGVYAAGDSFALSAFMLKKADAVVTFWPRHAAIFETMTDKPVFCIPMGIKNDFWTKQEIAPLSGSPALFTAENMHNCKWPIDMFYLWPHLIEALPDARLHVVNIPLNQQNWWWPLSYMNGCRYTMFMTGMRFDAATLRNYLSAAPYYYSPVRYGDHNRMSLEAAACGSKVISFEGNEYAHYWVREGDGRRQTEDLIAILSGKVPERQALPVPDISDTATAMLRVYKEIA